MSGSSMWTRENSASTSPSYFNKVMGGGGGKGTKKPLPLKQRTSSEDPRRDFNQQTWTSLLGLLKFREYLVTVDHFSIWRRHLAWGMASGEDLREHMTKRYSTSMVFMSLLLGTELGVLFNSAGVTTKVREAMANEEIETVSFWIGILIIFSAVLTLLSLISTFTAWGMVSAIHKENAYCVLRSSIGQYAAELPGRFIVTSIYVFLLWVILFFFLLLPVGACSAVLLCLVLGLFLHTITAFSSFGRIIMHSGAMGSQRIFDPDFEKSLSPHLLHQNLLTKARVYLDNNISIRRQYGDKRLAFPLKHSCSEEELAARLRAPPRSPESSPLDLSSEIPVYQAHYEDGLMAPQPGGLDNYAYNGPSIPGPPKQPLPPLPPTEDTAARPRSNSLVKFSDGFDTTGKRVELNEAGPPKHQRVPSNLSVGKSILANSPSSRRNQFRKSIPKPVVIPPGPAPATNEAPPSPGRPTEAPGRAMSPNPPEKAVVSAAAVTSSAPAWIQQQRQQQRPVPDNRGYQYQQPPHTFHQQYHHNPSPFYQGGELSSSFNEKWLLGTSRSGNHNSHALYCYQQPVPTLQQPSGNPYNFHVPPPPTGLYGYDNFASHQQTSEYYRQHYNSGVPAAVTPENRGISSASIPSQVGLLRQNSVVSELDNTFPDYQSTHIDAHDNIAIYDDRDIEELLDPPTAYQNSSQNSLVSYSTRSTLINNPTNSNASVHTSSTQGSDDKASGALLAGLAIEVDEENDPGYMDDETGALLQSSPKHTTQYNSFVDELKEER